MLRSKSNCSTMLVDPRELVDVISVTPAINPNWRSRGAATDVAMVSGSAPGRFADTWIVGKSTRGSGETGSKRKEIAPARTNAMVRRVVPTGLLMKVAEMFMAISYCFRHLSYFQNDRPGSAAPADQRQGR